MHMSSQSVSSSQDYPWAQQKGHEIISALYTAYSRTVAFVKSFMLKINWGRKAKCSSTIACYTESSKEPKIYSYPVAVESLKFWCEFLNLNQMHVIDQCHFTSTVTVLYFGCMFFELHTANLYRKQAKYTHTLWIINGGWDSNVNFFWFIRVTSCF